MIRSAWRACWASTPTNSPRSGRPSSQSSCSPKPAGSKISDWSANDATASRCARKHWRERSLEVKQPRKSGKKTLKVWLQAWLQAVLQARLQALICEGYKLGLSKALLSPIPNPHPKHQRHPNHLGEERIQGEGNLRKHQ